MKCTISGLWEEVRTSVRPEEVVLRVSVNARKTSMPTTNGLAYCMPPLQLDICRITSISVD